MSVQVPAAVTELQWCSFQQYLGAKEMTDAKSQLAWLAGPL